MGRSQLKYDRVSLALSCTVRSNGLKGLIYSNIKGLIKQLNVTVNSHGCKAGQGDCS